MYVSLIFWAFLTLPGYVALRRLCPQDRSCGLLGLVALSFLLSWALVSPVSILCYVFHAPLWMFCAFIGLLVLAAAIEITRQGWWGELCQTIATAFGLELVVLGADLIAGARAGTFLGGDGMIHLARIRTIVDHGFNNFDPFLGADYFFPLYHTTLYHALFAACSWTTGVPLLEVWFASLVWAKALVAAGAYYLAWCCFERTFPAWLAVMFTVAWRGHITFLTYPNKLAPYWICACMLGFAVQAVRTPTSWTPAWKLTVGSLLLGQVHSLYGAFAGIFFGPVLTAVAAFRLIRRRPGAFQLLTGAAGLAGALPFLLVSKGNSNPVVKPVLVSPTDEAGVEPGVSAPEIPEDGRDAASRRVGWGDYDWRTAVLAIGIGCGLAGGRRRDLAVLLAVAAISAAIQYVPPIRTAALELFRAGWIVNRMGFVLDLALVVLAAAAPGYLLERLLRRGWQRFVVSLLALGLGAAFLTSTERPMWRVYWEAVPAERAKRMSRYSMSASVAEQCRKHIPRGACVLAPLQSGIPLVMLHDCRIVAPGRGSVGAWDVGRRRKHLVLMLAEDTPWEQRRELLRKYGVEYFYVGASPENWTRGHVKAVLGDGPFRLLRLNTD